MIRAVETATFADPTVCPKAVRQVNGNTSTAKSTTEMTNDEAIRAT